MIGTKKIHSTSSFPRSTKQQQKPQSSSLLLLNKYNNSSRSSATSTNRMNDDGNNTIPLRTVLTTKTDTNVHKSSTKIRNKNKDSQHSTDDTDDEIPPSAFPVKNNDKCNGNNSTSSHYDSDDTNTLLQFNSDTNRPPPPTSPSRRDFELHTTKYQPRFDINDQNDSNHYGSSMKPQRKKYKSFLSVSPESQDWDDNNTSRRRYKNLYNDTHQNEIQFSNDQQRQHMEQIEEFNTILQNHQEFSLSQRTNNS
jgi:hypothetical protein